MDKVKDFIKCNICKEENKKGTHYCRKCGKNLSDMIEKTDVLFFFSKLTKWIGILLVYFGINFVLMDRLMTGLFSIGTDVKDINRILLILAIICFVISIILFVLSFYLKKHTLKLCEKNLELE